jgi:hypothetical protein
MKAYAVLPVQFCLVGYEIRSITYEYHLIGLGSLIDLLELFKLKKITLSK